MRVKATRPSLLWLLCLAVSLFGCGSSEDEDTTAPEVVSTTPADGVTGVALDSIIEVTFSESMDAATVQASYDNTSCANSVRVSADDFATCVRFASGAASNKNKTYTFLPIQLSAQTAYKIKVTTAAEDVAGNGLAAEFLTTTGFVTE